MLKKISPNRIRRGTPKPKSQTNCQTTRQRVSPMPLVDNFDTAVELAGKLLLKKGRISLKEIRRVPFVESELEAMAVAQNLIDKYDVEVVEDKRRREITLHLHTSTAKRIRDWERRRRAKLRRTFAG